MTFDDHWTKVLSFNPALAENPFLRPLAEAAWNAAAVAEREACAKLCGRLAAMMEQGAGELAPGGRLRQAEQAIRTGRHYALKREAKGPAASGRSRLSAGVYPGGYWCVVCGRFLTADEDGVIVHDDVPHPDGMTFDEEERPQ